MFHWIRTVRRCTLGLRSPVNAVSLLAIITLFPLDVNAQKNVVSLSPTFDFDGDGLSEFLAVEKKGVIDAAPSSAVYYEIDDFGAHMEIWRHTTVDHLVTAQVGDINGDESPEIVLLSRSSSLGAGVDDLPWLKVFQWTGVDFSPSPSFTIGGVKNNSRIRPSGLTMLDFDNNESDEIAYAEGSPTRLISVKMLNEINGELIKVNANGMGWMLVKKGVFEKTEYPWFGPIIMGLDFNGEDVAFQVRAKDVGFDSYAVSYTHLTLPTNREV